MRIQISSMAEGGKGRLVVGVFAFASLAVFCGDLVDGTELAACWNVCMMGVLRGDGDDQSRGHRLAQAGGDVVAGLAQLDESADDLALAGDAQRLSKHGAVAVELAPQRPGNPARQVLLAGNRAVVVALRQAGRGSRGLSCDRRRRRRLLLLVGIWGLGSGSRVHTVTVTVFVTLCHAICHMLSHAFVTRDMFGMQLTQLVHSAHGVRDDPNLSQVVEQLGSTCSCSALALLLVSLPFVG